MSTTTILPLSDPQADLENVGGKGASLSRLVEAGLPVPEGFHITTQAYRRFVEENGLQPGILAALELVDLLQPQTLETAADKIASLFAAAPIPEDVAGHIVQAYATLPGNSPAVAVRSSATAEDLPEASFAGQQETYLNVSGPAEVLEAVRKCWASLWTARAIGYRSRQGIEAQGVALAVVVQLLVPAEAAGILFSANPIDGNRHRAMISASWGLGEAVVGGLVTPDSLTIDKSSGAVVARQTANKLVQTVRVERGTDQVPVPEGLRSVPVLSDDQAAELAMLGVQIENLFGLPVDVEWTLTDGQFAILQARPITAMPEPPLEWAPPDPKGSYIRASVVDLMPDPLSPLFISLGIPTFMRQMQPLGKRVVGSEPVLAEDYFTSINSYAYMNSSFPPRSWWWILTGLIPAYPRLLGGLVPLWREDIHPQYLAIVSQMRGNNPALMSPQELWGDSQRILDAVMYYVCALMFATMGASAGSEGLLTRVYEKLVRREGDPPATTLLMGWDNIPVRAEKSLYDLASWVQEHPALAAHLRATSSEDLAVQLQKGPVPVAVVAEEWRAFEDRFHRHLEQYGHIIYQMDFAHDLPLDHPEPMLETIKMYLCGEGANPHERQQASEQNRIRTTETMLSRLKGPKLWVFKWALNWGQTMAEVREDALAEIGLGYPMLRALLLELGERLKDQGVVEVREDIFWLEKEEIDHLVAALTADQPNHAKTGRVAERKAFWQRVKAETPPPMIPMKERIMGIKAEVFIAHTGEDQTGDILKGVATSAGQVTAPARVLLSPADFAKMRPGDVLVAGTTTPAWTPLFSMASGVVTDIGGPLSHGSIVAREFGIPAVMGTGVATKRIQSGQTLRVDGNEGTVTILNGTD